MSKNGNFSVFSRLFLIYTLIIVLIYAVLIVLFLNNINSSSRELVDSKKNQVRTYLKNLEQQLGSLYSQEVNLTNYSAVTKLAYSVYDNDYQKSQLILELMRNIEGIQSMSPLIEDVVITYPSQSMTLSSLSGYEKKTGTEWGNVHRGAAYNKLLAYDDKLVMNFSYPLTSSVSDDYIPDFNIQIVLSKEYLRESLDAFRDERGSGAALRFNLDREVYIEGDSGAVVADGEDSHKGNYQFITEESMKFPLSVVAFIDRHDIIQIIFKYITVLTVVMIVISSLFAFSLLYTKRIVIKPLRELINAFRRIQGGDFDVRIYHEPHDEFNYLYNGFNDTVTYIEKLIADIYEQESLLQNAELAQLQSQINPHFLYNSFFIINRMAKNESYELITQFVTSLARYYRFINKETKSFIPLSDEVGHMVNYIDIQQMRFGEKITVERSELPEALKDVLIPKLILQPLIENAYNYGLANKLEKGLIKISYIQDDSLLRIIVEDNGDEADAALVEQMNSNLADNGHDGGNHALFNIHKRLVLAYGNHCGAAVELSSLGGVKVVLTIDLQFSP